MLNQNSDDYNKYETVNPPCNPKLPFLHIEYLNLDS